MFIELIKKLIFGRSNVNVAKKFKNVCEKTLCPLDIRIDSTSIVFFLGRWLPFSVAVGVTMGVIASLMDLIVITINNYLTTNLVYLFIYPIFVAIATGIVIRKNHEVAGPGIGFSILHLKSKRYLKFKYLIGKLIISVLTLSGGFIAGREGPSFFLGIGIGEWVGKAYGFGKKFKNMLALIGGGAFTGALLKAPLGSAIFAMELEDMYDFDYRPFIPMIVASIVSYLTFSFFRGNHAFINLTHKAVWNLNSIPYIIAMGFAISAVIYIYTLFFHFFVQFAKIIPIGRRPLVGTVFAIPFMIALYYYSNNIEVLSAPVHMAILSDLAQLNFTIGVDFAIIIFTIIITSFTLGFGIPGGLILPVLIIGAALGNVFGHIFPNQIVMFTLAGMGAALSAAAKTPLAAIVMITEMSHDDVVIPMTAAVITSYLTSFGYSLYLGQENIFRSSLRDFKPYKEYPKKEEKCS